MRVPARSLASAAVLPRRSFPRGYHSERVEFRAMSDACASRQRPGARRRRRRAPATIRLPCSAGTPPRSTAGRRSSSARCSRRRQLSMLVTPNGRARRWTGGSDGLFEVDAGRSTAQSRGRLRLSAARPRGRRTRASSSTRIGSARCSTDFDLHLLERRHPLPRVGEAGIASLTVGSVTGVHFAVWAPNAQRVSVDRRLQPVGRPRPPDAQAGAVGRLGDLHSRSAGRRLLQVRGAHAAGHLLNKADPYAPPVRSAAEHRLDHLDRRAVPVGRRRLDARSTVVRTAGTSGRCRLRGAPRIVAPRARRRRTVSDLPRAG